MKLITEFDMEEMVILKTDKNKSPRIITAITFAHKNIRYCLMHADLESWHYEFEIERQQPQAFVKGFNNK